MSIDQTQTLRLVRAAASQSDSSLGSSVLPVDLLEASAARLQWVALAYGATFLIFHILARFFMPAPPPGFLTLYTIIAASAVTLGGSVCLLGRSGRLRPEIMVDIGLVFEVLAGLILSIAETAEPYAQHFRAHSSLALWIVFFVLVVPASLPKTLLAAFATAAMGPVGMAANILVRGYPVPPAGHWVIFYVSTFLTATWAVLISRYIYRLGQQAHQAKIMGSYELLDLIGEGGMGEVWRARHRLLVRESALKLIRLQALNVQSSADAAAARRRFEREARATAALRSPHTVSVYDFGVDANGSFYYVMEFLHGLDLDSFVKRFGPQSPSRVIHILRQICNSLDEAHTLGLTHRDIKPRNIFLCRLGMNFDFVKVLDFGLVKVRNAAAMQTQLTQDGAITGTPAFMAPEIALGSEQVDPRADLYAVGCVAYWLLTGELVFSGSSGVAMAVAHVQSVPVPPSNRTEIDIPDSLERIVLWCLEKDPAHRPQSARDLSAALDTVNARESWNSADAERWWTINMPSNPEPIPASEGYTTI